MMIKRLLARTLALFLFVELCAQCWAANAAPTCPPTSATQADNGSRGSVDLRVKLLTRLSTKTNSKGDTVTGQVTAPEEFAGDFLEGRVTESKPGKSIKGTSQLSFVFNMLHHREEAISVEASIKSFRNSKGQEKADEEGNVVEKKDNRRKIGTAGVIGAIIGGVFGGGKGAGLGGLAGAGLVLVLVKFTVKGANVSFDPGSEFIVETYLARSPAQGGNDALSQPSARGFTSDVEYPSSSLRNYSGNYFRLSIPDNWRELPSGDNVTFAPQGAYGEVRGQFGFTYGVQVGTAHLPTRSLRDATDQLINALVQANRNLSRNGDYQREYIGSRDGLSISLSNLSEVTNGPEIVVIYTTMRRNGDVFFLIAVAPQIEYQNYQGAFLAILRTVALND
jgi:hypothetical protein